MLGGGSLRSCGPEPPITSRARPGDVPSGMCVYKIGSRLRQRPPRLASPLPLSLPVWRHRMEGSRPLQLSSGKAPGRAFGRVEWRQSQAGISPQPRQGVRRGRSRAGITLPPCRYSWSSQSGDSFQDTSPTTVPVAWLGPKRTGRGPASGWTCPLGHRGAGLRGSRPRSRSGGNASSSHALRLLAGFIQT